MGTFYWCLLYATYTSVEVNIVPVASHDIVDITRRSSSPGPPRGPQLDVQGSDASLLALHSHILGSQHGSVGWGLIPVSLHLHAPCHTSYCLPERGEKIPIVTAHTTERNYWQLLRTDSYYILTATMYWQLNVPLLYKNIVGASVLTLWAQSWNFKSSLSHDACSPISGHVHALKFFRAIGSFGW